MKVYSEGGAALNIEQTSCIDRAFGGSSVGETAEKM